MDAAATPVLWLATLHERYDHYALTIRGVSPELVRKRAVYLQRLFQFPGSPESAAELFAKLGPEKIGAFLADYARHHGPGSRRDMHATLRVFLHFAYEEQFLVQDLAALVPTVRPAAVARLPKALPEDCIVALEAAQAHGVPSRLSRGVMLPTAGANLMAQACGTT